MRWGLSRVSPGSNIENRGLPSQPGAPSSQRQDNEILVKQRGHFSSEHPPCKPRARGAGVPGGILGQTPSLTSMMSIFALVKSTFSSLGSGTPTPSTPVGHKPSSAPWKGCHSRVLPGLSPQLHPPPVQTPHP